ALRPTDGTESLLGLASRRRALGADGLRVAAPVVDWPQVFDDSAGGAIDDAQAAAGAAYFTVRRNVMDLGGRAPAARREDAIVLRTRSLARTTNGHGKAWNCIVVPNSRPAGRTRPLSPVCDHIARSITRSRAEIKHGVPFLVQPRREFGCRL